jgi:hypothetical protein
MPRDFNAKRSRAFVATGGSAVRLLKGFDPVSIARIFDNISRHTLAVVCAPLVVSLGVLGCSAESDEQPPTSSEEETGAVEEAAIVHEIAPMYTVSLEDSVAVYFWEYEPGEISIAVSGPIGVQKPEIDDRKRIEDILAQLQPNEPIPAVIAKAQIRQDELRAVANQGDVGSSQEGSEGEVAVAEDQEAKVVPKNYSEDAFLDAFCYPAYPQPIGSFNGWVSSCAPWRTGGGTWIMSEYKGIKAIVAVHSGTVTHQLSRRPHGSSTWTVLNTTNVSSGNDYWQSSRSNGYRDYRYKLYNASGDTYHRATHLYTDDCYDQHCCRFSYPDSRTCPINL